MVITTTNEVQDKKIVEYKGIVFGEVISGVNMFKDLGANLRNIFGGRSKGYENFWLLEQMLWRKWRAERRLWVQMLLLA